MRLVSAFASSWLLVAWLLTSEAAAQADDANLHIDQDCDASVTLENANLGFGAVWDPTCLEYDLGCFEKVCRLCKKVDNEHTKFYESCADLPKQQTPTPTEKAQVESSPFEAASAIATTAQCAAKVSPGDQNVGITAISDPTCSSGGLGCFGDAGCKYCRTKVTVQSQGFRPCSDFASSTPSASTNAATTPSTTSTLPPVDCPSAVTRSGLSSVSYVTETSCATNSRLTGCVASSSCRLCRTAKNEANQFLVSCKVLRDQQQTTTTATTMSTADASTAEGGEGGPAGSNPGVDAVGGVAAVAGIAMALAVFAVKKSKARRIVDASDHLTRGSSLVQVIGRDRIAEL